MSKVKVTFIGTGDASNSGGRAHQSILLEHEQTRILVDCGANTLLRFQQLKRNPNDVDVILFTHFHADHFLGMANFDLALIFDFPRQREIIYAGPIGLKQRCEQLFQLCYPSLYPSEHSSKFLRRIEEYKSNRGYTLNQGQIEVETLPMQHSLESLGYRISIGGKCIAITGDTQWHDGIIDLANNSDLFICESFHFHKPNPQIGHCSYEEINENQGKLNTKQIILTHGSKELLKNEESLSIPLAQDGQILEI